MISLTSSLPPTDQSRRRPTEAATRTFSRTRERAEQLEPLKGPPQTEVGTPVRRHATEVLSVQRDHPAVGLAHAGDDVEQGRLPGTIRDRSDP